jgi:queuosine precursor transporter
MFRPRLSFLFTMFISLLIGMNLLGGKITTILGVSVSVGIFMVPLTFLITDIVEEVYGKKITKYFIFFGVISLVVTFAYVGIFVLLEPHERYQFDSEYGIIFGSSLRIIAASIIAFFLAQLHDMVTFAWLKKKTHGKALWLRNNLSTFISQFIDSTVFMLIAFYQVTPKFTFLFIMTLVFPYYIFKIVFAVIDTPFVYLGVKWLKKEKFRMGKGSLL